MSRRPNTIDWEVCPAGTLAELASTRKALRLAGAVLRDMLAANKRLRELQKAKARRTAK